MNAYILRKNEVRICEKVSNNLGQLSSTLPLNVPWTAMELAKIRQFQHRKSGSP